MIKELIDYPGYFISCEGIITKNGNIIKQYPNGRGYLKAFIKDKEGNKKSLVVHRLVAKAFIPNPDHLPVVNHIDGNKHNNKIENLEWVTYRENSIKFREIGSTEIKPVVKINPRTGKVKEVFSSISTAAKCYQYDYRSLYDAVKRGISYRGFLWKHCALTISLEEKLDE